MKNTMLALILILTPTVLRGQSEELREPWQIIERCITFDRVPEVEWTFDGTILIASESQLIGYSNENGSIHSSVLQPSGFPGYGRLSPDGLWSASIVGTSRENGLVTEFTTTEIQVFSTVDERVYSVPWENSYGAMRRVYGHQLYWLDETRLLYSKDTPGETWFIIDPFSGETVPWAEDFNPTHFAFELAPDAEKGLSARLC